MLSAVKAESLVPTQVVEATEGAGLCRKVARLVPLAVTKG